MNFSCLHQHASAFFNNFISQSSSPFWIKGLWFKRSVARIVLISFTFGQLAPLVPAQASCQEESQDQSQSPSTPLLVRSAQQNEPRDPAPRVPAIRDAASQPQAQTMRELLLARLAAYQAQNPVPAPVVSAPQINAAPQVHGVPVIPSAYLSLGPIGRSPLWNYGEGSKIPAIREMAHADAFLSWPAETPFAQEMTTELRRTANLVTGDKFISCVNEEESTGSQLRAKIFDGLAQHRLTLEALLAAVQTHHSGISLSLGNIPALGMCGVDGHYPGERAVAQWIEQLCSTIGTQQFYLRVIEMFLKDAAQPGRNILPNPQLGVVTLTN
jgi:hypothetical protein